MAGDYTFYQVPISNGTWENTMNRQCPKCGKWLYLSPVTSGLQICTCPPEPEPPKQYAEGWVCPVCGRVSAPWVSTCPCWLNRIKTTYGNTTTWTASGADCTWDWNKE